MLGLICFLEQTKSGVGSVKIQSVKARRVFTGESCFTQFAVHLIFFDIKCEMCPYVCSPLPPKLSQFVAFS